MNYSAKQKGSSVTDKGPGRTPFAFIVFLLAFRFFADIHPALGSGGCFQLLQGQLDGGVTVAGCRVDGIELAQALVQIDRHALVHPKGAHTAGGMTHIGFHLIFQLPNSYSVMAQTRAGRPVAPSMRG